MKRLSPILWPGDKTLLGPEFLKLIEPPCPGGRVLDPFCGSVGIHLHHAHPLILGDTDENLVILLREVGRDAERLLREFQRIPSYEAAVAQLESRYQHKRAAAFMYVLRASRFPHVRYTREGKYKLPFYHEPKLTMDILAPLRDRLRGTEVLQEDYHWVLQEARPGDLVLLDPPYIGNGDMYRTASKKADFDHAEVVRVAEALRARGVMVIVTLNNGDDSKTLTQGAGRVLTLPRKGSGRFSGNVPFYDLIAVYYDPPKTGTCEGAC